LLLLQWAETQPLIVVFAPQFEGVSSRQSLEWLLLEDGVDLCLEQEIPVDWLYVWLGGRLSPAGWIVLWLVYW
jgi:hypothetical protein